jgi:beta-galactosidase
MSSTLLGNVSVAPSTDGLPRSFEIGPSDFLLDGQPMVIRVGEIHFARVPREYWRHRLQMCKAMGLNAVCVYLFWNFHEWEEGKFDWSGQADVVEFCRMAQEEGLWVLLRPGPYSCAEWEMGGLPWWLLRHDNLLLRSSDPRFVEPAVRYLKEVGRVLAPQQVTRGGPLLMVQVENEYGSYGNDAAYMGAMRQALLDGGFEVPLFACNPPGAIGNGFREDLFQVVNFGGGGGPKAFETLRRYQKTGPLMNGEYYPGWFDTWGRRHRTGLAKTLADDLEYMLQRRHSFSIYMAHGGTSFGFWAGADRPFIPDTSSYDYDAPISEAGWVTPKFDAVREVFAKYLQPGETLPEPPAAIPVIAIEPFHLNEKAAAFANLPTAVADPKPRHMEAYGQSRGHMVYRSSLPAGPAGTLSVGAAHDFAWVFIDGTLVGAMDRRRNRYRVDLPARSESAQLDIYLATMGRVNFGREVFDRKGLHGPVRFNPADGGQATELANWEVFNLPLDHGQLASLRFRSAAEDSPAGPAFWRGRFEVATPGDTFLDVRSWGKGVVWVNGHCLGRFWNIGPTQTMYLPGVWLREGSNEIVVLDLLGPQQASIAGLPTPILDELRLELDFARPVRAKGAFTAEGLEPVATGQFAPDAEWQAVRFAAPATGRYLCLESVNAHSDSPHATVAEIDGISASGEVVSKAIWKIFWVSSEEIAAESGEAQNALDGQPNTHWHSAYSIDQTVHPHRLIIDLGTSLELGGIRHLGRAGDRDRPGRIKDFRVFLTDSPYGLQPAD